MFGLAYRRLGELLLHDAPSSAVDVCSRMASEGGHASTSSLLGEVVGDGVTERLLLGVRPVLSDVDVSVREAAPPLRSSPCRSGSESSDGTEVAWLRPRYAAHDLAVRHVATETFGLLGQILAGLGTEFCKLWMVEPVRDRRQGMPISGDSGQRRRDGLHDRLR